MAFVDSITLGDLNIIQVDADPSVSAVSADIGSFAVLGDGAGAQIYQKFGAGDTDWKRVTDDDFLKSQTPSRTYFVDKKGNDTSGDGSIFFPYLTIGKALTEAAGQGLSLTSSWVVKVGAGSFIEAPLTLPENVKLAGEGVRNTTIIASDQNSDLITGTNDATITDINIIGPSNPSNYAVRFNGSQPRGVLFVNCSIVNCVNGLIASSTVAEFKPIIQNSAFVNTSGVGITLGNNTQSQINLCRFIGNGTTTTGILTEGTAETSVNEGLFTNCNLGIDQTATTKTVVNNVDLTNCTIPWKKLNSSKIKFKGASFIGADAEISNTIGVNGYALDEVQGEEKLRVFDELSVGIPGKGKESVFGEGDSYVNGSLVYTFDGSSFTDVTEESKSFEGSSFTFPGTGTANKIYVSTQRTLAGTLTPVKWFGIKANILTAAVGGEIIAEYWNGSSWIEFNHLSTESSGQYLPYAKQIFQRTGSEQIRFNDEIDADWALNDPVGFGTDLHWVRFSIVSTLTTTPVFEQFKIHSNRTEINDDGYVEFFGKARTIGLLPFDSATFQAANNSPQNTDAYFGDNLAVGRIENRFEDGVTDRSGFVIPFPEDMDTSCPVKATFYFYEVRGDTAPNYDITIRWSNSVESDTISDSSAGAPTTAPRQQTIFRELVPLGDESQIIETFDLDVSDVVTRRGNGGKSDLFWCTVQRGNDGNTNDLCLLQVEFLYVKRSFGGHI